MRVYKIICYIVAYIIVFFSLDQMVFPQGLKRFDRVINTGSMLVPGPIIQDEDGFLWIGTQGSGLIKFDGISQKRFYAGSKTILDGNVTALLEDNDGLIWIATLGGLNSYNKETNTFQSYKHNQENPKSISHDAFNASLQTLLEDKEGNIWIGTQNGLNQYDKNKGIFIHYRHSDNPYSINSNNIFSLYQDKKGFIWIGTDSGLNRFDIKTQKAFPYTYNPKNPLSLSKGTVYAIHEDKDGVLWIGTSSGLNRFNRSNESFFCYINDPSNSKSLTNNSIHSIYEDKKGYIWIGHSFQGSGLTIFDKKRNIFTNYRNDPKNPTTLSGNSVMGICEDISGIIWLTNLNGTLDKYDKESHKFNIYLNSPDNPNSISDKLVNTTFEDSDGTIWFSTNNGLNRYNRESGKFKRYLSNPKDPESIPGKFVCGPYEDSEKNLWVVSSDNFISIFNKKKGIVSATYETLKFPLVVIEDKTNSRILWITSWGNGLGKFDKKTFKTVIFTHDPKNINSISNNNLVDIYQDEAGIIWLPTMGGGLDLFDPRTGKKIKSYKHNPDDPKSIGSNTVSHIFKDSSGTFWASTYGGGLNKFNKIDETFERFTKQNGFPTNSVTNILEDDRGNLWIGSKIGYIKFNRSTKKTKVYTTDDGLAGNEFQEAGLHKSRDGTLWLATITGANSFHPSDLKDNPFIPQIYLTSFKQGGVEVDFNKAPEKVKEIRCDWRNNFFEFEFVVLNYTNSNKNTYAYKLEGFDTDWNNIGVMRYGKYTNIPGGSYTLHLKGANNDGIWNEKGSSIKLFVESPPWQRWWAYCIYVAFILLIILIVFIYIKKLQNEVIERKQAEKELKKIEKEKRKSLEHAAEQEKYALIGQIAGKIAHDFNNILGIIMGNSELSLRSCEDEKIKKTLELIIGQTVRGRNLTRNLVAFAKDQEPKQEFFQISDKINLAVNLLKKELSGISIIRKFEPGIPDLLADPGMIEHTIINLIQNSYHALINKKEKPMLTFRTYTENEKIFFEIEDNGCGIPEIHQDNVFSPSFTLKGDKDVTFSYKKGILGTGYGLSNVKRYIEKHKGNIRFESAFEKGTKFTISLPIIRKKLSSKEKELVKSSKIFRERKILLVEDEQAISDIQSKILSDEPFAHKIDVAFNGKMAIDLINKNKYDLISLDYILSGDINGMDVYNHIRIKDKNVPIIFVSGNIQFLESMKELNILDPRVENLSKPCQNIDYVNKINDCLKK